MTKYEVEFSYAVPEWGDITLEADTQEEAEDEAINHVNMSYPEAIDIEITGVKALD